MKKHIDAKTELKKPKTFVQKTPVIKRERYPDLHRFLRPHSQETLNEVLADLKFVTGREDFHPFQLIDVFLHYWIHETRRKGRSEVAKDLLSAQSYAYRRTKEHQKKLRKGYEQVAERLLEALLPPDSPKEATADV